VKYLLLIAALAVFVPAVHAADKRLAELDAFWAEVSRSVKEGDFPAYEATCHDDAVLVAGTSKKAYPLSQALVRWKKEFDATKAGDMTASVEFRWNQRLGDDTTAHETGIFLYKATRPDGTKVADYVEFQALLLKRNGKWLITMEYQKSLTTKEAFEALKAQAQ
jgi:ketosteroid isomerase-like protein